MVDSSQARIESSPPATAAGLSPWIRSLQYTPLAHQYCWQREKWHKVCLIKSMVNLVLLSLLLPSFSLLEIRKKVKRVIHLNFIRCQSKQKKTSLTRILKVFPPKRRGGSSRFHNQHTHTHTHLKIIS